MDSQQAGDANVKDATRALRKSSRRTCSTCARAHLACDDERPCSRCIKRDLQDFCVGRQKREWDTTGQICPPGVAPRVTATLWEGEGTLVFHVEIRPQGITVSRREDNHMINGSPLMVLAGMRSVEIEAFVKAERTKHVVEEGPEHFRGAWLPYERTLELANLFKLTERLYPLFVHDIGALLYCPGNRTPAPTACPPPVKITPVIHIQIESMASQATDGLQGGSMAGQPFAELSPPTVQQMQKRQNKCYGVPLKQAGSLPPPLSSPMEQVSSGVESFSLKADYSSTSGHPTMDNTRIISEAEQLRCQDRQMQLMCLDEANKKRLLMARQEQEGMQQYDALQNYQMPLMLLEQENNKRLLMAKQESEAANVVRGTQENRALQNDRFHGMPLDSQRNHALQDYHVQLALLESQNKKGAMAERSQVSNQSDPMQLGRLEHQSRNRYMEASFEEEQKKKRSHLHQDYQMYLMLLEQQNKKRLLMARQEAEAKDAVGVPQANNALQNYEMQLSILEGQNKKRLLMERRGVSKEPFKNPQREHPLKEFETQLKLLEEQCRERMLRARQDRGIRESSKNTTEPLDLPPDVESSHMEWEEIIPGDCESPPTSPRMTPPGSPETSEPSHRANPWVVMNRPVEHAVQSSPAFTRHPVRLSNPTQMAQQYAPRQALLRHQHHQAMVAQHADSTDTNLLDWMIDSRL